MIETSTFEVAGIPARPIVFEETVATTPDAVFEMLTSASSIGQWLGVDAHVELAIGGAYELYFLADGAEGSRGSEGCKILAYVPGETLAVSWNAPPTIPETRNLHTWVVFTLSSIPGGCHVRLVHTGFGSGDAWDETREYFRRAWPSVLDAMSQHLTG